MDRREALKLTVAAPLVPALRGGAAGGWTAEWDADLVASAVQRLDEDFDPAESLLQVEVGAGYNYHSRLRGTVAHPTRQSLQYALALLEAGGHARAARAAAVLERVLALQDTDPASRWYGIWGYYLEEPPPKMSPADWNWADFNGATLLLVEARHAARLAPALLAKVREGIRHAAASIRRRNISLLYTNIALQGTFVTLAAAQATGDAGLREYAAERLRRFASTVDTTGSFAEYNSPTYANVSITNLTRMRMVLRDRDVIRLVERIHHRGWLHLASHWHLPTKQLAGPMSRCYATDIERPLWIQKALGGRLAFVEKADLAGATAAVEVAVHDYRCPGDVAPLFLAEGRPRQHRELFYVPVPGEADVVHARSQEPAPIQGTTWLGRDFCLGTSNRADFWVQRRPLLAYWGGPKRPARFLRLRFLKDDYDFSSALFFSVQERGCVLGLVNFRSPGGDRHIGLDPVQDGAFTASRLRLCLEIVGAPERAAVLADPTRVAIDLGGARLWFRVRGSAFGKHVPGGLATARESDALVVSLDLLPAVAPRLVRWTETSTAWAAFTLAMDGGRGGLDAWDRGLRATTFSRDPASGRMAWAAPSGVLAMTAATAVLPVAEHDRAFSAWIDGRPVPIERLSDERLVE